MSRFECRGYKSFMRLSTSLTIFAVKKSNYRDQNNFLKTKFARPKLLATTGSSKAHV